MTFNKRINHFRRKLMRSLTGRIGKSAMQNLKPQPQPLKIRNILVSRPNHRLGNLLLITPLIQEIQSLFPEAKMDLFIQGNAASIIFQEYPINEIIKLPRKPFKEWTEYFNAWRKIRHKKYDLVVNVEKGSASGRISGAVANAKFTFYGDDFPANKNLYTDYLHISKYPVYNFRTFLRKLGMEIGEKPVPLVDLKLTGDELAKGKLELDKITPDASKKTIAFFTYATGEKCYSKAWWKSFYELFSKAFSDYNLIEILPVENVSQLDFALPAYYSREIREIGALMHHCQLVVAGDSGMMHLSSASLTPTIGLFSVTKSRVYEPYGNHSRSFDTNNFTQQDLISAMEDILRNQ